MRALEQVQPSNGSPGVSLNKSHIKHICKFIEQLEPTAQLDLWKEILDHHPFNLKQLNDLRVQIERYIKLDIISQVPYEIALYIMSFLDPKDICQAAQTCRSWRTVCEDNRLWREKCSEDGLLHDDITFDALFRKRIYKRDIVQNQMVKSLLTDSHKSVYKAAYMKHIEILRNWRHRKFDLSEPFISQSTQVSATTPPLPIDSSMESIEDDAQNGDNKSNVSIDGEPQNILAQDINRLLDELAAANSSKIIDQVSHRSSESANLKFVDVPVCSDSIINQPAGANQSASSEIKNLVQLRCHEDSVITCLQYNPKTNTIVSGSDDQTLRVWSSETGRCINTLEGHTGGVWSSQLSPDDIVISGSTDRMLKVWEAHTGKLIHTLQGHTSTVRCLALDGKRVVSGSRDTTLRLWDIIKGKCLHVFTGHSAAVRCVEYKNDTIVSGAYDHLVMVWNANTGLCQHVLERHISRIYSLQFDGNTIASGSLDSTICIWDADTGTMRHHLVGHTSLTSKMQLKDNLLVSANADSLCKIWDVTTGECLHTLAGENKHQSAITSVYFNRIYVVTSSDDGTVKLWDLASGKFIRNLIVLPTASQGGVVWRIRASYTKLICAVGSRTQTEDTHLLVLNFSE